MASVTVATFTSAGKTSQHVIPGAYSRLDVLAGASGFVSVGNVVLIGSAQGGEPQKLLQFNNQSQALNTLKGGPLYDAIRHAFNPSPDPDQTPQRIFAMRVNNAARSSYELAAGGNDIIRLQSRGWGTDQNQIQISAVANAANTLVGRDITLHFNGEMEEFDRVERGMFSIHHTEVAGMVAITEDSIIVSGSTTGGNDFTLRYTDFNTVQDLAVHLNRMSFLEVAAVAGSENMAINQPNTLDIRAAAAAQTAFVITANTQELITRLNDESRFVTAELINGEEPAAEITPVANLDFFGGGTNGDYNTVQATAALTALEAEDIQVITTPDPNDGEGISVAGIHGLIMQHCTRMTSVDGRRERQFILGGSWGGTVAEALAAATALNSYLGMHVYNGFTERDAAGVLKNWGSSYQACRVAGLTSILALNEPLTFKLLQGSVLENRLNNSTIEMLIRGGVCVVGYNDNGVPHIKRQVNTYQIANKIFNEFSAVREGLFANRDLRSYIEGRITGRPGTAVSTGSVEGMVINRLADYVDEGIFIGDAGNPPYSNVSVELDGDTYMIDYDANLTLPVNFGFITSHFRVFASSAQVG